MLTAGLRSGLTGGRVDSHLPHSVTEATVVAQNTRRGCLRIEENWREFEKGQLNRHTSTGCRVCRVNIHKVPTSHYHAKHCHAVVASLGELTQIAAAVKEKWVMQVNRQKGTRRSRQAAQIAAPPHIETDTEDT